jgi:hypothetical protein
VRYVPSATSVHETVAVNSLDAEPTHVTTSTAVFAGTVACVGPGFTSVVTAQLAACEHAF